VFFFFFLEIKSKTLRYVVTFTWHLLELTETADGGSHSVGVGCGQRVGTSSDSLVARLAAPDTDSLTFEGELSTEAAEVTSMLADLKLLGTLTGVSTITGTISSHDSHLGGTFGHFRETTIKYRNCSFVSENKQFTLVQERNLKSEGETRRAVDGVAAVTARRLGLIRNTHAEEVGIEQERKL